MRSKLSEAVARCQLRRLRHVAGAAPLPVAGIALVVALAPVALYRAGQVLGADLGGAIDGAGISDGIALGPLLAAMVAGAVLAVSLPGRAALGAQITAGPPGRFASILAITVVPAIGGALIVLPSLVALCVGLARELPGGADAGLALAAAIVAAVPVGAIVADAGIAAARARRRRAAAIMASTVAWAATGSALGGWLLGPLALVPSALGGERSGWLALVVSLTVLALAGTAWVALAATRPPARPVPANPRLQRPRVRRVQLTLGLGSSPDAQRRYSPCDGVCGRLRRWRDRSRSRRRRTSAEPVSARYDDRSPRRASLPARRSGASSPMAAGYGAARRSPIVSSARRQGSWAASAQPPR